jgi:hypothetical protein
MRVIRNLGSPSSTVQNAPRASFSRGAATRVPLSRERVVGGDHAIDTFREAEDEVDAATPVDAQNAPTGVWKSRQEREIPTASTSIILLSDEEEDEEQNHSDQLSTESDQPHPARKSATVASHISARERHAEPTDTSFLMR